MIPSSCLRDRTSTSAVCQQLASHALPPRAPQSNVPVLLKPIYEEHLHNVPSNPMSSRGQYFPPLGKLERNSIRFTSRAREFTVKSETDHGTNTEWLKGKTMIKISSLCSQWGRLIGCYQRIGSRISCVEMISWKGSVVVQCSHDLIL